MDGPTLLLRVRTLGENSLIPEEDIPVNLFMVAILLVAAFATAALTFFGIQEQDMNFIAIGISFGFFLLLGLGLTRGEALTGPGSFAQVSFGYWAAHLPFLAPVLAGRSLSLFSAPTDSHLSIVQQAQRYVQVKVNLWMAPISETVTILGVIAVLFIAIKRGTRLGVVGSLSIAIGIGGTAFALLHGARDPVFFTFAFVSLAVWAVIVFGNDLGWWEASKLALGLGSAIGLHKGNNMADLQVGVVESWRMILAAPEPIVYISWAIVLFEIVSLLAAVWFVITLALPWIEPFIEKVRG